MKKILIPILLFCYSPVCADPVYKFSKYDCIPEIKYFKLYADVTSDIDFKFNEKILTEKYNLLYGDFDISCNIENIVNINLKTEGITAGESKYSKTNSKSGILKIFINNKLVHENNDFHNYDKVANFGETYFIETTLDNGGHHIGIQHCVQNKCNWVVSEDLDKINNQK